MKYYDKNTKTLDDEAILEALRRARKYFEDGAILECRVVLEAICRAIQEFKKQYDGQSEVCCKDCRHLQLEDLGYATCAVGRRGLVSPCTACGYGERREK